MQHFISEGAWSDEAVLERHAAEVSKTLWEDDGVLILDGSDFSKKGADSAGVARQYCRELGKVENCQAGVFLGYASSRGYTLLDRRLYLPKAWFCAAYAKRRQRCGIPAEASFKRKSELALVMVERQAHLGLVPYRWLVFDEFFGQDGAFLEALGSYGCYLAELPNDSRVYLKAIRIVNYYQKRHEAAHQSHRKRRLAQLGEWLE